MFLTRLQHRYRFPLTFLVVLGFSLFLAISSLTPSRAIPVSKIPNPRQQNSWVTDMAELLSPEGEAKLNQMITALEETNGAEIAVVTVPDTQSFASPKAFTTELFNTWGIGKKGQDNGVLVMVSKGDRRVEIETGYGVEAILPDAQVGNIIRTEILPAFKQEEYETGIVNGTLAIALDIEPEIILPKALQQKAVALLEIRKQDKIKQVKRQQERLKRNQELSLARQQRQLQLAEDKQQRLLLYQQLPIAGGILTLIGLGLFLKKAQQQLQGVQLTPTPLTTTGHPQEQHLNQGGTLQAAEIEVKSLDSTTSLFRILAGIGLALISAGVMGWVVIAWIRSWILFVLPATVVGLLLTQSLVLENIIAHIVGHLQSDLCKRFNLQSWSLKRARRHASTAQYVIPTTLLLVFLCLVFYIPFVTSTSHESSFAPDVLSAQLSAAFSLTVSLFSALAFQNLQRAFRRHLSESFFCYDCGQKIIEKRLCRSQDVLAAILNPELLSKAEAIAIDVGNIKYLVHECQYCRQNQSSGKVHFERVLSESQYNPSHLHKISIECPECHADTLRSKTTRESEDEENINYHRIETCHFCSYEKTKHWQEPKPRKVEYSSSSGNSGWSSSSASFGSNSSSSSSFGGGSSGGSDFGGGSSGGGGAGGSW